MQPATGGSGLTSASPQTPPRTPAIGGYGATAAGNYNEVEALLGRSVLAAFPAVQEYLSEPCFQQALLDPKCVAPMWKQIMSESHSPSFVLLRLPPIISTSSGALDNNVLDIILVAMLNIQKTYVLRLNIGIQYTRSSTVKELGHY